jgi:hypothetical protein
MTPSKIKGKREAYVLTGQTTLAASSNGQIPFQIADNFKFVLTKFSFKSQVNAANAIPTFDFQIMKNERGVFQDFVPNDIFPGRMVEVSTAPDTIYQVGFSEWFKLDMGYPYEPKSNMIVNLRDTSGQINTIRFVLAGFKILSSY